jgi:hypothetical protein
MIRSTRSESRSAAAKVNYPSYSSGASQNHATRDHVHLAFGAWPSMSLAEPDIDSLWDNSLLDRLSAPITRYHE